MRGSRRHKLADFYLGVFLVFFLGLVKRLFPRHSLKPTTLSKVLFIKLAAVGDTVLFLSIIKAFKQKYPASRVEVISSPINYEILKDVPFIDKLWVFPLSGLNKIARFFHTIREEKYDLAVDGEQWSRLPPILTFYARIKYVIGFRTPNQYRHYLYDLAVDHSQNKQELFNFLDLVKELGIETIEPPSLYFTEEIKNKVEKLWSKLKLNDFKVMIFHPGCGRHGKQREWPLINYAELAEVLRKEFEGLAVIITGGKEEADGAEKLEALLKGKVINLSGKLSLMEMSYLISKADLFISGNTGPMHIAAAVKTPLIALHGPTNLEKWGPVAAVKESAVVIKSPLPCSPCLYLGFEYGCERDDCMPAIKVEEVLAAAKRLLKTSGKPYA